MNWFKLNKPYFLSFTMGWLRFALWRRIWCILPVDMRISAWVKDLYFFWILNIEIAFLPSFDSFTLWWCSFVDISIFVWIFISFFRTPTKIASYFLITPLAFNCSWKCLKKSLFFDINTHPEVYLSIRWQRSISNKGNLALAMSISPNWLLVPEWTLNSGSLFTTM